MDTGDLLFERLEKERNELIEEINQIREYLQINCSWKSVEEAEDIKPSLHQDECIRKRKRLEIASKKLKDKDSQYMPWKNARDMKI